ncbi:hypothetical protein [Paracoccus beibuensis]|uniref:hypothetical protein n=1 Tax=Paracoccus beibuensis TaxID=547602 RepID=UPI003898FF4A
MPDDLRLAQLWWQIIGDASSGAKMAQEPLDALCQQQEDVLDRLARSGGQGDLGPVPKEPEDPQVWLDREGAPKLEKEKPEPVTIS